MNAQIQNNSTQSQRNDVEVSFNTYRGFQAMHNMAETLAHSTIIPEQFRTTIMIKDRYDNQAKKWLYKAEPNPSGVSNCIVALNMAQRLGADPMMVMQNLYLIDGRPSWSSQFIIAAINSSGRYSPLRFEVTGGDQEIEVPYATTEWVYNQTTQKREPVESNNTAKVKNYTCIAWVVEKETGERLESSPISMELAVKEGWYQKNGSKWQTMPEQMLRYRAASFFGRIYAPDLLMGLRSTEEEQERIIDVTPAQEVNMVSESDFKQLKNRILKAKSLDALEEIESSIYTLSNELERNELTKLWNAHADKYKAVNVTETVIEPIKTSDQLKKEFILNMNNSTTVDVLQGFIEMYKANETLTPAHKKYLDGVAEQNMAKFEGKTDSSPIDTTQSLNIITKIKEKIAQTNNIQVLETAVANEINASKASLTPGHHQDVLITYAQRKEILSQGDIFADPTTLSNNPVDQAISRIEKCQSQDDINSVWEEIENDPYLTRTLSAEDRKLIEAAADRREAEIQG